MRSNSNIRLCLFQYYYELVDYYDWIKDSKFLFYNTTGFHPDMKSINPLVHIMLTSLRYVTQEQTPYPLCHAPSHFCLYPPPSKRYVTFERPLIVFALHFLEYEATEGRVN